MLQVSVLMVVGFKLSKLHPELLTMLGLKFLIRDVFEAKTVVPSVKNGFNKVLLQRLNRVLFPEVLHLVDRSLWKQALANDTLVSVQANFGKLLRAEDLVEAHSLNDCDFLALTYVQLKRLLTLVFDE